MATNCRKPRHSAVQGNCKGHMSSSQPESQDSRQLLQMQSSGGQGCTGVQAFQKAQAKRCIATKSRATSLMILTRVGRTSSNVASILQRCFPLEGILRGVGIVRCVTDVQDREPSRDWSAALLTPAFPADVALSHAADAGLIFLGREVSSCEQLAPGRMVKD